jgi:hypothetical protein
MCELYKKFLLVKILLKIQSIFVESVLKILLGSGVVSSCLYDRELYGSRSCFKRGFIPRF